MSRRHKDVLIVGDTHAEWGRFNTLLNKRRPRLTIILGDFGWWPRMKWETYRMGQKKPFDPIGIKVPDGCEVLWLDGNHEDHEELRLNYRLDTENEIWMYNGVTYKPRGSTLVLPDGRKALFFGGATSVDKKYRTIGIDWFEEEVPSIHEFNRAMDCPEDSFDIIFSHTCPEIILPGVCETPGDLKDPTRIMLDRLVERYKPELLYFGHWHTQKQGIISSTSTKWQCLNHIASHQQFFTWL